jgi:hypothetical protein
MKRRRPSQLLSNNKVRVYFSNIWMFVEEDEKSVLVDRLIKLIDKVKAGNESLQARIDALDKQLHDGD